MPIVYDSPIEQERMEAIREGLVFCDLEGDRIVISWSPKTNRLGYRNLPLENIGGTVTGVDGGWMPLSLTNCHLLRTAYEDDLEVSERLDDWAVAEAERIGNIDNLTSANSDAVLSENFAREAPAIARVMHPYQRAGVAFCAATRQALLADQPGLGKTLQTLGTMVEAGVEGDILVAAPTAAVAITWPDELSTWLPDDEFVAVIGTGHYRHKILGQTFDTPRTSKRRWIIVNLEMCRAEWVKPRKVVRRPKNNPTAPPRPITEPGWWDFRFPELFGDFEVTDTIERVEIDGDETKAVKEQVKRTIHREPWAAIVIDESQRCLITHSGTPQSQTQVRAGMGLLPVAPNGIKLALSGTPFRGKPENLWGTLNWLHPKRYSSYWDWVNRWFFVVGSAIPDPNKPTEHGSPEIKGLDESKSRLFYDDIKAIMLRRTKKEVRAELPDKLYAGTPLPDEEGFIDENSPVGHWIDMSPKQAKAYHDIRTQAETMLESGVLVANGVLAELTRLKQFATCYGDLTLDSKGEYKFVPQLPSAKFDWLLEFLDGLGINKNTTVEPDEEERKVVVASQFTSILDLYEEELRKKGIETLKITGKVTQRQRKINKDRWQQPGGPRVFLLNTAAGGVSLTLDAADDLVFLDETWIPDDQEQVEDRIHRVSRIHQVTIHYLRALGTVEEQVALTTMSRERLTKLLIDGERGVKTAKKLLTPIKRVPRKTAA